MARFAEQLTTEQRLERRLRDLRDEQESEIKTDNNYSDTDKTKLSELPDNQSLESKLNDKVDKINGKGLSDENYTSVEKNKLSNIENGAEVNVGDEFNNSATYLNLRAQATTSSDVGLGNVDNTSDSDKPVSTAQQTALDSKVDKVTGKGLSSNDYTDNEKNKLSGIESGADVNPTNSEIKVAYESNDNTNEFSDSEQQKLGTVESGAEKNQTDSEIKTQYENNADTNAYTDSEKSKLGGVESNANDYSLTYLEANDNEINLGS